MKVGWSPKAGPLQENQEDGFDFELTSKVEPQKSKEEEQSKAIVNFLVEETYLGSLTKDIWRETLSVLLINDVGFENFLAFFELYSKTPYGKSKKQNEDLNACVELAQDIKSEEQNEDLDACVKLAQRINEYIKSVHSLFPDKKLSDIYDILSLQNKMIRLRKYASFKEQKDVLQKGVSHLSLILAEKNWVFAYTQIKKDIMAYRDHHDSDQMKLGEFTSQIDKNFGILKLENWTLKIIPPEIEQCVSVKTLILDLPDLVLLPEGLQKLTNLEELAFYYRNLSEFPKWICDLKSLKYITFRSIVSKFEDPKGEFEQKYASILETLDRQGVKILFSEDNMNCEGFYGDD